MMRIGLLGGAFNPPHLGHLKLAELALHHLELDELRFVPTAISPHKPVPEGPGAEARLRLLQVALMVFPGSAKGAVKVETAEIERGGTSYTAETLETLTQLEPSAKWILIIGSDQLPGLPTWHRSDRVLELASIAVAPRPGFIETVPDLFRAREKHRWSGEPGEIVWLPGTELPLASSVLRQRIAHGEALEGLPLQVMAAISAENLYR